MGPRHCKRSMLGTILAIALTIVARASGPAIGLLDPKPGPAPDRSCMSTDEFARRSLARRLRFLTVSNESVHAVVDRLVVDEDVPLSFIQSDDEAKNGTEISFDLAHPTVQEALEELVHLVPGYRYATIEGHILLFPSNSRWETQVDNVHIGPETRRQAASELASELRRRLPTFSDFGTFFIQTSQFVYEDQVSVVRGGSVAELLARLLGNRPAAIFSVSRSSPTLPSMFLSLGCVTYWNALLIAPSESVMHVGESIQLKVAGSPHDGTTHQSITAGACGTDYWISDTNIADVSADGLITAKRIGEAWVKVTNAGYSNNAHIEVKAQPTGGQSRSDPGPPHRLRQTLKLSPTGIQGQASGHGLRSI